MALRWVWRASLLAACFLSVTGARAQSVLGIVRARSGEPLEGVHVILPESHRGAVTGADGSYRIDGVPPGDHEIEFRHVGYAVLRTIVWVPDDGPAVLDVALETESVRLRDIVVTAEGHAGEMLVRASRSVSVISTADLAELQGRALGDILGRLPGVTTLSTGPSIAKPVIRGLHSQRVLVLQDGVGLEGQQWGGEHAPEIDPFAAGRIEVVRGAASVEYGAGAIGGVVRVDPPDLPESRPIGGTLSLRGFSNNRQGAASLMVEGGPRGLPGLGWRARVSGRRAGDSSTPDYVLGNTGFEEVDVNLAAGYHRGRNGMHVMASRFSTTLGLFKGAHIGNVDDLLRAIERGRPSVEYAFTWDIAPPKQDIVHDILLWRGHVALPGGDVLESSVGYQSNRRSEFDAHARGRDAEEPAFSLTLRSVSGDLKVRMRPRGSWIGVAGISWQDQSNRNGESGFLIPNYHAITGGAFALASRISGTWTHEFGVRLDRRWMEAWPRERLSIGPFVRRTHEWTSMSAHAGTIRKLGAHWSLAAQAALAWRPPGVNELYNFGVHHGTAQFEVGDPTLGVERGRSADLTLRHEDERWTGEVTAYVNRMSGFVHLVPEAEPRVTIRGSFPSFRYTNADVRLAGAEGSLRVLLGWGFVADLSASVVRGTDTATDDPLVLMPADRARFGLSRTWVGDRFDLEAGLTVQTVASQARFVAGADFANPPAGYRIVGLDLVSRFRALGRSLTGTLSADNLLNTPYRDYLSRYRYFVDDPGRTVSFGLLVPFGSAR